MNVWCGVGGLRTDHTGWLGPPLYARARDGRVVRGVRFVGFVGPYTEGDALGRVVAAIVAGVVVVCLVVTGVVHGHALNLTAGAVAGIGAIGLLVGLVVGAAHARHERAWQDYRNTATLLPRVRLAWLRSLGTYARRLAVPVGLIVLALFWLKGRHH